MRPHLHGGELMAKDIIQMIKQIQRESSEDNYQGEERRKENDPAYFGHFSLEGIERRQSGSIFS